MRIKPIVAGAAAGVVLATGAAAAVNAMTASAEAQGRTELRKADLDAANARSQAAIRLAKSLQNGTGKYVASEGVLIGAREPAGVIRQDRGVGGGLPEEVLSADVRAKLNAGGPQGPPGPSTGPAGGDLSGSYPDPQVGPFPAARLNSGSSASPGNNSAVALNWTELPNPLTYDPLDMHTAASPDRLTAPRDGLYQVSAGASWSNNATGSRLMFLTYLPTDGAELLTTVHHGPASPGTNSTTIGGGALFPMRAGDAVRVIMRQSSGGALSVTPLRFSMVYVGALA